MKCEQSLGMCGPQADAPSLPLQGEFSQCGDLESLYSRCLTTPPSGESHTLSRAGISEFPSQLSRQSGVKGLRIPACLMTPSSDVISDDAIFPVHGPETSWFACPESREENGVDASPV